MLRQPVHEFVWGPGGQLSLQVTALPAGDDPAQVRRPQVRRARGGPGGAGTAGDRSPLVPLQDAGPAGGAEAPGRICDRRGTGLRGWRGTGPGSPGGGAGMGKEAEPPVAGPAEQRSSALIPLPSAPLHFPNPKHDVIPKVQPPSHISGTAQTDRAITADTHTHARG